MDMALEAMKRDVTKFSELPMKHWPDDYGMKYTCPVLEKYYENQSFHTPSTQRSSKAKKDSTHHSKTPGQSKLRLESIHADSLDLDESIANAR